MEVKPGYRKTEVGLIPNDWRVACVEDFAEIATGGKNTQDRINDGRYPFFVRSQTVERIDTYSFDGEAVLTAGDGAGTGRIFHYIDGRFDTHQRVYRMSHFGEEMNGYFFYLYFSMHFYGRIMQMTAKSSVDSVRRDMIARMPVPVPTRPEQEAIAEALSSAGDLIESLKQLIAKKRLIRQGAKQALLTGKMRLPGFSGEWSSRRMGDVFRLVTTRNRTLNDNVVTISGKQGFVRQEEYFEKRVASALLGEYYLINRGHFAYNRSSSEGYPYGAIKRLMRYDAGVVTTLYVCFAIRADVVADGAFFEHYFEAGLLNRSLSQIANEGGRAHGLLNVTKANFFDCEVWVPSGPEQVAVAAVLSDIDSEITALEKKLERARQIKQGMMQELLTGRIRLV